MNTRDAAIPYEKQADPRTGRMCGAACLAMVYRSFGKDIPQLDIWPAIAKINRFGSLASTTHLIASDALNRGFSALAAQARHPLQTLQLCREAGIRVILNHRLQPDLSTGHYTVLVDIDERNVVLHDPFFGASRRISHPDLLELWRPHSPNSEIAGFTLIAIAGREDAIGFCGFCRSPIPASVICPRCKNSLQLRPAAPLGCLSDSCPARMWNHICCPACDYTWAFKPQPVATPDAFPSLADINSEQDKLDVERLFEQLDKFTSHILNEPLAANHQELKQQLAFIISTKQRLRLAQTESLAHRKSHLQKMAALAAEAKINQDAHRKKLEELNTPCPPLDGNALGRALLKDLGFIQTGES